MKVIVAIDGPAASGKSTVARRVASRLGHTYVDSGAVYRAVAWKLLEWGVNPASRRGVVAALRRVKVDFVAARGAVRLRVNGDDPGIELKSEEVSEAASLAAIVPEVRRYVVARLRRMTMFGSLVVEGRDIGTAVFPEARFKFYLDASPEERARRRHAELVCRGGGRARAARAVGDSLRTRDRRDSKRRIAPLKTAKDAVVIDTTRMGVNEVVEGVTRAISEGLTGRTGSDSIKA